MIIFCIISILLNNFNYFAVILINILLFNLNVPKIESHDYFNKTH